jgi:hypothetical protein
VDGLADKARNLTMKHQPISLWQVVDGSPQQADSLSAKT